ncbi:AAA family ATPase [Clavibacter sepedonicus]|uniref:ATP-binding protein n=1 Tax=Clavibacter sepedonicus TaxID=31964 RepID=B0RH14_CLASE|nr:MULTISPECIES: AAA family ATPase [Clavibacter]MBD5380317.1 AAA family ATPase [Clavibacter sp.]UUK66262.1 AAA family ATPase [Clavibacter sepedonicus]CAQ02490.1 putative ATP-binding protein [Clavibacter sepedonicus]
MISSASVTGLVGEFDHTISLEADWEFAIAYGLNGVGKTKFLELINAAINVDMGRLATAWFATLELRADDGDYLQVEKLVHFPDPNAPDDEPTEKVVYRYASPRQNDIIEWLAPVEDDINLRRRIQKMTPYIPIPGSSDLWRDPGDGEIIDYAELRMRYGTPRTRAYARAQPPEQLQAFLDRNATYLIETQRLATIPPPTNRARSNSQSSPKWNVEAYAGDLRQRIERSLAENSLASQRLDRSFPGRIIAQHVQDTLSEEAIRHEYLQQDIQRRRLVEIGLTSAEMDVPLPDQRLQDWQRAVLTTYLKDNAAKLATFDDLLQRITLLVELVNARFLRKEIRVNADDGLTVQSLTTGQSIPASGLSTGEQHELVLMYNLLFRVHPGTLVLIDEPEISLHVTWQKHFLADVARVAELRGFRFIVATHSPQIIGRWWSRTVELGPGEDA